MGWFGSTRARPRRTALSAVAAGLFGVLIGVGAYTASYAGVTDYLGKDPQTCANCHAMNDQYDAWAAGPHAHAATCGDCHLPHDNIVHQYLVKAEDGVLHAAKFTTGDYPQNIVIRDKNLEIANEACLYCHADMTAEMTITRSGEDEPISCVHCHSGIGHE